MNPDAFDNQADVADMVHDVLAFLVFALIHTNEAEAMGKTEASGLAWVLMGLQSALRKVS